MPSDPLIPLSPARQHALDVRQHELALEAQRRAAATLPQLAVGPAGPAVWQAAAPQLVPRKQRFTRAQLSAVWFGSLLVQTIIATAVHLIGLVVLVGGFSALLQAGAAELDQSLPSDATSFTGVVAAWTHPDRFGTFLLIALLSAAVLVLVAWICSVIVHRTLWHPHASMHLGALIATVITGTIGCFGWPLALIAGFAVLFDSAGQSLPIGGMWSMLFALVAGGIVLSGLVGMCCQAMFLFAFRPWVVRPR